MNNLTEEQLERMVGGASITGSLVQALNTTLKTIFDLGRSLGSAIRRWRGKAICEIM